MRRLLSLLIAGALLCSTAVTASSSVNTIADIQVSSDASQEKIQLLFPTPYDESVSTDFESGMVQLTFPRTAFDPSLAFVNVNDRFVRSIRLVGIGDSTILEVRFADPAFDAIGMVREQAVGKQFTILINKKEKFKLDAPVADDLTVSDQSNTAEEPQSQFSRVSLLDSDMTINIVKMLVALFLLLLFFYLLLWAYNRFFATRFRFHKGDYDIKVSASYHINPKQKIIILEVNGIAYACGVTANTISVITRVSKEAFSDYLATLDLSDKREIRFADIRTQYLEAKRKKESLEDAVNADSRFASELIQRIKNLKPLD